VTTLSPESRIALSKDQASCDLAGETAVVNLKSGVYYGLDPMATHVWKLLHEPVTFGGRPFWKSSNFGPTNNTPRAGGDGERTRQMLSRAGYKLPAERMSVRLVHLVDESRRKELMVIYAEDLAPSGYTAAQLRDGNEPRPEWKAVEQGLVERAMSRIKLSPKPFK